jgi:hypothetical protein
MARIAPVLVLAGASFNLPLAAMGLSAYGLKLNTFGRELKVSSEIESALLL